ncbi:hypothetical protein [Paenibacillus tengchongensis]|uniref:hypothetical protein n=1 Tax=Paenibacillus tengchongensis TaxID=2608684 RepID=UPI00124ED9BF|nr:hypothetical protein [Paenibacillus tengchongensis]
MAFLKRTNPAATDPNTVIFGADGPDPKTVKVRKIVITQWRDLFAAVQTLPQLIVNAFYTEPGSRIAYVLAALDHALDEIVEIVAVLTGIEAEWIADNTSPDELLAYFVKVAQVNDFGGLLKNAQSVLSLAQQTAPAQDAA